MRADGPPSTPSPPGAASVTAAPRHRKSVQALAIFPSERRFDVIDHPEPAICSPTEVRLRMLDVGICGTDKEIVAFEYGTPPPGSPYLVIGHESLAKWWKPGPKSRG